MGDFWNPAGSKVKAATNIANNAVSAAQKVASKIKKPSSLAQQYSEAFAPKTNYQTSFGQVMPKEAFMRPDLLSQIAFGRVDPEIQRQGYTASRNLEANLGTSGGARFGQANVQRQGLLDDFERQRQERSRNIYDQLANSRQQEYNDLENQYYTNPNAFTMPTLAAAPTTGIPKDFVNPSTSLSKDYRFGFTPNTLTT